MPLNIALRGNVDDFKKKMDDAKSHVGTVARQIVKQFDDMNLGIGASIARTAVASAAAVAVPIAAFVGLFKIMNEITDLGKQRITELNALAAGANAAGVSPEFFQRATEAAKDLRVKTDDVAEALKKLNAISTEKLGGSDLTQRVDELQKFGNFKGNTQVDALKADQSPEQRLATFAKFFDEAVGKGERLAALDLAGKFMPPELLDRLWTNNGFLDQFLATAKQIETKRLISDDDVNGAQALQERLDAAQKVIADKFTPIMTDLAKLGVNYQASWVSIEETIASASRIFATMYDTIKSVDDVLQKAGNASFWDKITAWQKANGLDKFGISSLPGADPAAPGLGTGTETEDPAVVEARRKLAIMLQNGASISRGQSSASGIYNTFQTDKSKSAPPPKDKSSDTTDRLETAENAIKKRAAALDAETATINLNTEAREKAKTTAQLEEIAKQLNAKAGLGENVILDEQRASIDAVAASYGRAAAALENVNSPLATFARDSANVGKQLNAAAAGELDGFTNSLADVAMGTKRLSDAFRSMANSIIQDLARIAIRQSITGPIAGLLGLSGEGGLFGGLLGNLLGTGGGSSANPLPGLSASDYGPGFASGTDFAPGGRALVGENGPELVNLPRGAQVIPNDILRGGMGGSNHSVSVNIDLTGANGDDTIRKIAAEASMQGVQLALSQVPNLAVKSITDHQRRQQ